MSLVEQLAFRIIAEGADLIAAGARLRDSGHFAVAMAQLANLKQRLELLHSATEALDDGQEQECRLILEHVAQQRGLDSGPDPRN